MKNLFFVILAFLTIPILAMAQNSTVGGQRLKILIPVRNFTEFVSFKVNPNTGMYTFSGFAIEVFQTVMNEISIEYDFVPFAKPDGTMNGSFGDMLNNVSSSEGYDGAVGEISILYTRSQVVDFTTPYLDTSISMLVRLKRGSTKSGLGTVTKYVVASSLVFSFVVALLFWFLEYRNDRRTSRHRIANSSSGQSPRNNDDNWRSDMLGSMIQTRLVMILFFMVLLILIACYTASQTASLASQRPIGSLKSLEELKTTEANVGFREGSFIRDMLAVKGIDRSKLIPLYSEEEMVNKLSKGTSQGGVDAIVADHPTLKLLVAKHCDVFTIQPMYNLHAAGLGFAFRQKYERLSEISEGILRIIQNGELGAIQERTIGNLEGCTDDEIPPVNLDSDTLWILVAGAIGVLALIGIVLLLYCGNRCNTRSRKSVAYPCYLSSCY